MDKKSILAAIDSESAFVNMHTPASLISGELSLIMYCPAGAESTGLLALNESERHIRPVHLL
ncbi:hypothetical protein KDW99_10530 [Marinomonas rhizomae]|uniref:hypothetical protein n=1 Tax=Marinomonas rhizomae TaxID=491948 RepID=UPI002105B0B6|nr:hypothetical protein [Marinomonas rhizomae]UTV97746.1 hypothetical protein KDW99_10530 [Marinomonas rhizomae]